MRVWKKIPNCWRCDFFDSAQTRIAPSENGFVYDGRVSGAIIYTYVDGNPLSFVDPLGLAGGPPVRGTYYPRGQTPQPPVMSPRQTQQELLNTISDFLDPYNPNFGQPIPGWPRKPTPVCRMVCPSDTPNSCSGDAGKGLPKRNIMSGEMCTEICDTNQSMTQWK